MARLNFSVLAAALSLSVLTSALPTKRFDPMADGDLLPGNPASIAEMSLRSTVNFFDDMEEMWKEDQAEKNKKPSPVADSQTESSDSVTSAVPMVPIPATPSDEASPSQQSHGPLEINKTSKGETSETYNDGLQQEEAPSAPSPAPSRAMNEQPTAEEKPTAEQKPKAEEKPSATTPQPSSAASAAASPSGSVHEVKDNIFAKIPVVGKILSGGGIA